MARDLVGAFNYRAIIMDSIHGSIPVNTEEYWILQTPFLRRLHGVKQLGLAYLVFPSAKHSRLEHSIGVMHIAGLMAKRIVDEARKNRGTCERLFTRCSEENFHNFIQAARLAGLIHDMGHTPYSHMMEDSLEKISHERPSLQNMLARVYEEAGVARLHEAYTQVFSRGLAVVAEESGKDYLSWYILVAMYALRGKSDSRVLGIARGHGLEEGSLHVIRQITSNPVVDADRLDYLRRDAWFTGVIYGYIDIDRIIRGLRLGGSKEEPLIVLDPKSIPSLEDMFDARYKMFKSVYLHHKMLSIRLALKEALSCLLDEWGLSLYSGIARDPEEFLKPETLNRLIGEARILFDDSEIDVSFRKLRTEGSPVCSRWSNSLIHRRELLPISLIKRPDTIAGMLGARSDKLNDLDLFIKEIANRFDELVKPYMLEEARKLGVERADIEKIVESVSSRPEDEAMYSFSDSLYLRAVTEIIGFNLFYAYMYSVEEQDHEKLYRNRERLSKAFIDLLKDLWSKWRS